MAFSKHKVDFIFLIDQFKKEVEALVLLPEAEKKTELMKSLEWPVVFTDIDGYENDSIRRDIETEASEEARRLFFVSCTRAREELFVVGKYVAYGPASKRVYNRFLKEALFLKGQFIWSSSIEAQLKLRKKTRKLEKKAW